ncbi:MAG: hypothetical protein JXR76_05575 [Deltaproteobacteria bacterium]|nr:hypothetical protein [Deltaproteobacteria bacterium]
MRTIRKTPAQSRAVLPFPWWFPGMIMFIFQMGCQSCAPEKQQTPQQQKRRKAAIEKAATAMPDTETETRNTEPKLPPFKTLIKLNEAPYGKFIAVDDTTVYLLVSDALWRFSPDHAPQSFPVTAGHDAAFTDTSLIFWQNGALFAMPKTGGTPRKLSNVAHQPRKILSSGNNFSWFDLSEGGSYTFHVLRKGKGHMVYRTINPVTTPAMIGERIYFVEKFESPDNSDTAPSGWRIGSVSTKGEPNVIFGALHPERTPAMLNGNDNVMFYDLPGRTVRSVTPDLSKETTLGNHIVCTPFAVSNRVLCARVEGIFEMTKQGTHQKVLANIPMGLTVNIAASDHLVVWLSEIGDDQLALRALPLSPLPQSQ